MKLYMPKILFPSMNLPLDATIILEIDETEHEDVVRALIKSGWVMG